MTDHPTKTRVEENLVEITQHGVSLRVWLNAETSYTNPPSRIPPLDDFLLLQKVFERIITPQIAAKYQPEFLDNLVPLLEWFFPPPRLHHLQVSVSTHASDAQQYGRVLSPSWP